MNPATTSNTLLQILKIVQYEKYGHLAAGGIAMYDYVITFGQEVDLIWVRLFIEAVTEQRSLTIHYSQLERLSVVKVLFLANRYCVLASLIYDYYGEKGSSVEDRYVLNANRPFFSYHYYKAFLKQLRPVCEKCAKSYAIVQNFLTPWLGILQLRIHALYPDNKRVLSLMVSTFVVSTAASSVLTWRIISAVPGEQLIPLPGGQFCIIERPPLKYSQVFFVPMFLFEALLFFLAAIKGYYNLKRKPFGRFLFHRSLPRLADVLFRDSVIYFAAIGATHITCFLIWTFFPLWITRSE
ncbi:hypothetical protein CPC08DRAFT_731493 [Agrocybe pediades]|nr:hypothetical protein CPC08DRAFT_731493 [Agrocybe pediades]